MILSDKQCEYIQAWLKQKGVNEKCRLCDTGKLHLDNKLLEITIDAHSGMYVPFISLTCDHCYHVDLFFADTIVLGWPKIEIAGP